MFIDLDARKLDCMVVEIPMLLTGGMAVWDERGEGWTYERLRDESLKLATFLYSQPYRRLFPESVLIPYVEITLTDAEREKARMRLRAVSVVGHIGEDDHTYALWTARDADRAMERVNALTEAWDLLDYRQPRLAPKFWLDQ
jgi:hypothetical protein